MWDESLLDNECRWRLRLLWHVEPAGNNNNNDYCEKNNVRGVCLRRAKGRAGRQEDGEVRCNLMSVSRSDEDNNCGIPNPYFLRSALLSPKSCGKGIHAHKYQL